MRAYKLKDIISQGTKDLFYIWWQELKAVVKLSLIHISSPRDTR